jgi:glutathione S-transferase
MRVYGDETSGNCLKVRYTADHLGRAYEWVQVSALSGETREPDFLALNPMGQIPVVAFDDGRTLAQSNAIIRYLAAGSALLPQDPFGQAKVDEWLFWEQYSHEPYVAVCRFQMRYLGKPAQAREAWRVHKGEAALDLLERHLTEHVWLAGEAFSVADISLLAYTRLAHEGGFSLAERKGVRGWIRRCEGQLQLEPAPGRA